MKIDRFILVSILCLFIFCACKDDSFDMNFQNNNTIEFEYSKINFQENKGEIEIPMILSGFARNEITFSVAVKPHEKLLAEENVHFTLPQKTLTIPKGASSVSIPLNLINDNDVNRDRLFDIVITKVNGAEPARISQKCRVAIINEDKWPEINFSSSQYKTTEHNTQLVVPIIASGIFYRPTQVKVVVEPNTAIEGVHFTVDRKEFTFNHATDTLVQLKDSLVVTITGEELKENIDFSIDLEVEDGLSGSTKASKVMIQDVQKSVGFGKVEVDMLKRQRNVYVPVVFGGIRSPRQVDVELKVKQIGDYIEGTHYTLKNPKLSSYGDTTLYAMISFTDIDTVALNLDVLSLQIEKVEGADLVPEANETTIKSKLGKQLEPLAWKMVRFTTEEHKGEGAINGRAACLIDGITTTYWHTVWNTGVGEAILPYEFVFDLRKPLAIERVEVYRRPGNGAHEIGNIQFSDKDESWDNVKKYEINLDKPVDVGGGGKRMIELPELVTARYVRYTIPDVSPNGKIQSIGEIILYGSSEVNQP